MGLSLPGAKPQSGFRISCEGWTRRSAEATRRFTIDTSSTSGLFGNPGQILIQGTAVLAAAVYSGVVSFILLKLIGLFIPLRAATSDEAEGMDYSQHGEEAYLHAEGGSAAMTATGRPTGQPVLQTVRAEV